MTNEIFSNSVRSAGDLAGVFEYDGKTGYFYLYRTKGADNAKIIATLHIVSGRVDFGSDDIAILWDRSETRVALFIGEVMWALFDSSSGQKFGGNYIANGSPTIPQNVVFRKSVH